MSDQQPGQIKMLWNFCFGLRKRHKELSERVDELEDWIVNKFREQE